LLSQNVKTAKRRSLTSHGKDSWISSVSLSSDDENIQVWNPDFLTWCDIDHLSI